LKWIDVVNIKYNFFKKSAPQASKGDEPDLIDEAVQLFKANVFFRKIEFKGTADRGLG